MGSLDRGEMGGQLHFFSEASLASLQGFDLTISNRASRHNSHSSQSPDVMSRWAVAPSPWGDHSCCRNIICLITVGTFGYLYVSAALCFGCIELLENLLLCSEQMSTVHFIHLFIAAYAVIIVGSVYCWFYFCSPLDHLLCWKRLFFPQIMSSLTCGILIAGSGWQPLRSLAYCLHLISQKIL